MLKLEDIITKLKALIDANTAKIGKSDISKVSSDDTLTTGLVEANADITDINDRMGEQVTYATSVDGDGDLCLYITTKS